MQPHVKSFLAAALLCSLELSSWAAVQLEVQRVSGAPGASIRIPITLQSDTPATALQVDLMVSPPVLTFGEVIESDILATHAADGEIIAPGVFRLVMYSVFNTPIPNGTALTIGATISALAANGAVSLVLSNAVVASPAGTAIVNVSLLPGTLTVGAGGNIRLSNFKLTGGNLEFEVSGLTTGSFIVENSSDLLSWQTFASRSVTGGSAIFSAAVPSGEKQQFFRVRSP